MDNAVDESRDWLETVKPANRRIRIAIIVLDILLLLNGLTLIMLGLQLNEYVTVTSLADELPPIWALGILPIILGFLGIVCVLLKDRKWVAFWLLCCVILGVSSFMSFTIFRILDPSVYRTTIHVFGRCQQMGTHCKCLWDDNNNTVSVLEANCQHIRTSSCLFLVIISLFVLSTATIVISAILGCVVTFCLRLCAPQEGARVELHTKIYGTNMIPSNGALCQTSYCLVPRYDNLIDRANVCEQCNHGDVMTTPLRSDMVSRLPSDVQASRDQNSSRDQILTPDSSRLEAVDSAT